MSLMTGLAHYDIGSDARVCAAVGRSRQPQILSRTLSPPGQQLAAADSVSHETAPASKTKEPAVAVANAPARQD